MRFRFFKNKPKGNVAKKYDDLIESRIIRMGVSDWILANSNSELVKQVDVTTNYGTISWVFSFKRHRRSNGDTIDSFSITTSSPIGGDDEGNYYPVIVTAGGKILFSVIFQLILQSDKSHFFTDDPSHLNSLGGFFCSNQSGEILFLNNDQVIFARCELPKDDSFLELVPKFATSPGVLIN